MLLLLGGCGDDSESPADGSTSVGTGPLTTSADATDPTTPATTNDTGPADTTDGTDDGQTDDATDTDDPTTGEIPPNCGDGVPDADEACDDGNMTDADGCNNDCTISGSVLWFHSQAGGAGQNEEAFGVAVDSQGRAYVAGDFYGAADLDFWVRQYTEDDGLGWTQSFNGGGGNDGARAIAVDGSTVYAAGYTVVAGQSNNMWLRGFDLDGNPGLVASYNDPLNGSNVGQGVAVDPGGNIVVAANESGLMQGSNIWAREYTPAGATNWTAAYNGPANGGDVARAVAVDAMGNVAVVGYHSVTGQGRDIWIRMYDTDGNPLWTVNYGNLNALDDEAYGVAFDPDGNVVVAGFELDPMIPWRLWLSKYDPSGVELWTMPWDGAGGEGARAFGVAVDDAGDIVMTGQHRVGDFSQFLVRKVDSNGNERWVTDISGIARTNQVGRAVAIGPGRRIWVAGGVDQGVDGRDVYVARLAP